jgi:Gram-negative bacterial TonB protein C-terminal
MIRSVALCLVAALILAGGTAAAAQTADRPTVPGDHLTALAGTWTCRGGTGDLSTLTFRSADNGVVSEETRPGGATVYERFQPDGAGWRVVREMQYTRFTGRAASWTDSSWIVDGHLDYTSGRVAAAPYVERYELTDANTLRRTFGSPGSEPGQGEICARGAEPPDPALCAVHDVPPIALRAAMPELPPLSVTQLRINGTVRVLVSLDADSKVVATSIVSTPSALLNATATDAARRTIYRTGYHDCKPVPSKYIFAVDFSTQ